MNITGKIALFLGGTLFGSAGFKILASKDARKAYTNEVMRNVEAVQESCSDILADAKAINEERAAAEEAAFIEDGAAK